MVTFKPGVIVSFDEQLFEGDVLLAEPEDKVSFNITQFWGGQCRRGPRVSDKVIVKICENKVLEVMFEWHFLLQVKRKSYIRPARF